MQKDHTGLMLQFQADSCDWEHSAALFKGGGEGRVPSIGAIGIPWCCGGM